MSTAERKITALDVKRAYAQHPAGPDASDREIYLWATLGVAAAQQPGRFPENLPDDYELSKNAELIFKRLQDLWENQ